MFLSCRAILVCLCQLVSDVPIVKLLSKYFPINLMIDFVTCGILPSGFYYFKLHYHFTRCLPLPPSKYIAYASLLEVKIVRLSQD